MGPPGAPVWCAPGLMHPSRKFLATFMTTAVPAVQATAVPTTCPCFWTSSTYIIWNLDTPQIHWAQTVPSRLFIFIKIKNQGWVLFLKRGYFQKYFPVWPIEILEQLDVLPFCLYRWNKRISYWNCAIDLLPAVSIASAQPCCQH